MKKLINKIGKKKLIIIAIILVLVIAVGTVLAVKLTKKEVVKEQKTTFVTRGDVKVQITGAGTVEANEQYEITALVAGDVISANFEEGDILNEGDVMYTIDSSSVSRSIQKQQNSSEKTQMEHEEILDNINKLAVTSKYEGVVTQVNVKKGDNVSNGTKIAEVTDTLNLKLKINFNSVDAKNIYPGQKASVYLDKNMGRAIEGTVTRVSGGSLTSSSGVSVNSVEINVKNPGGIQSGDTATAVVGQYACNDTGVFESGTISYITSSVSGEVAELDIHEGDNVSVGQKVAQLTSESLQKQLRQSNISLKDAQIALKDLYDNLDKYTIEAPITGTVISKTTKAGDKLDNGNQSKVMAVIADMSKIKFEMSVDELDIAKLEVGQEAIITADALEDKIFTGYVDYISVIGSTSDGVTTYPVTIVINEPEGLVPGMNVDATITVKEAKDVLTVPVSAVNRGNIVYVKDNKSSNDKDSEKEMPKGFEGKEMPKGFEGKEMPQMGGKGENAQGAKPQSNEKGEMPKGFDSEKMKKAMQSLVPEGFKAVRVEVGLSNNDVVEIISGLSEGDEVAYTETQASTTNTMGFGGMGGMRMGGGMPSGGMRMGGGMPTGGMRTGGMGGR